MSISPNWCTKNAPFFQEIHDSTVALLATSASPEKATAGQLVRTVHTNAILCSQDTKEVSYYQCLDWLGYRERNLAVEAKNLKAGEKKVATPLKRKQDVPACCSEKTRRLPPKTTSHERRYNSGQTEPSEHDPCDIRKLEHEGKRELLAAIEQAMAFVAAMVFQDGSSQLSSEQVSE